MNKTLKRKWIKALRSGKYKQGERSLFDGRAHCCLGVLARVQGATARKGVLKIGGEDVRAGHDDDKAELPQAKFSGGLSPATLDRLACMNDGTEKYFQNGQSFKQIADYIEKKL